MIIGTIFFIKIRFAVFRYLDEGIRARDPSDQIAHEISHIFGCIIIEFCQQGPKKQHETYSDDDSDDSHDDSDDSDDDSDDSWPM